MKTVRLVDYSNFIMNGDATPALLRALEECKQYSPATLLLGGGEWHFYQAYATRRECYISNNDSGEKHIIFPLYGFHGLTVDGEGASLQFHGEVCPFVLDGSEDITLKNFSIDYPHPYVFQATVAEAEEDRLVLDVDPVGMQARANEREMILFNSDDGRERSLQKLLVCEFDRVTKAPSAYIPPYFLFMGDQDDQSYLASMLRFVKGETLSDTRIAFHGHFGHIHNVGSKLIGICGPGPKKRNCPGIFGNRCKNILLEEVTLYATGAMGVICQVCEDVKLKGVRAIPNRALGRYLSVNADATHFVNCMGDIVYEDCVFTHMLDDAANVHGIYYQLHGVKDQRELILAYGHPQQVGVNVFDAGDRIAMVRNSDFEKVAELTVQEVQGPSPDRILLRTREVIPDVGVDCVIENLTKNPNLYIRGCECGDNRPRGFLPATRGRIEITDCSFHNMSAALHFAGDCNSWYEASAVEDVLIRGNRFQNSAYAGGVAIRINPNAMEKTKPYHKNITIVDNEFEMSGERFLKASLVENLTFQNNLFRKNPLLPVHPKPAENGILVTDCVNVKVEECKELL